MILVDTSIWIDHLHRSEAALSALLNEAQVCTHPMIIGELALGSLRDRTTILGLLSDLPSTPTATHAEVLALVELHALHGVGLSLVDAHLLAALRLSSRDRLWTRDRRLRGVADRLGVCADAPRAEAAAQ
jgi:predicted nucleic acid-binding protein